MEEPQPSLHALDDQEESVRIAVKALGDMRNSALSSRTMGTLSSSSSSYSPSSPPKSTSSRESTSETSSIAPTPAFVSRMSHFPLVGSALRVYEQGKASSRVVKYGAEMVESSVKSISRPVIERLPVNVNQLDEFACRQLDRLDRYRRPSGSDPSTTSPPMAISASSNPHSLTSAANHDRGRPTTSRKRNKTLDGSAVDDEEEEEIEEDRDVSMKREDESSYPSSISSSSFVTADSGTSSRWKESGVPRWLEATSPFVAPPPPPPDHAYSTSPSHAHDYKDSYSRSSTPTQSGESESRERSREQSIVRSAGANGNERQVAQRSRWQAVLLEAGGLSAALSEESMRRLKYCLQWLQYATAHIDAQILILRDFTASLQSHPTSPTLITQRRPPISEEHMRKLTDVRRDIVHTIRQVVDVVSKYAGGALPEPARGRVRGFILKLPQRWASSASAGGPMPAAAGVSALSLGVERERETVAAASGTGVRRPGGQRRAAQRERGTGAEGVKSGQSSRGASPNLSPRLARTPIASRNGGDASAPIEGGDSKTTQQGHVSHSAALVASQRILVLATESLDMMRNVTGVVKDSLDRADAWVGRLRTVGIQRGAQEGEADLERTPGDDAPRHREFDLDFSDRLKHRHRRTGSQQSQQSLYDDDADRGLPSPFFSSASAGSSSTTWGSSIPSTPGGSSGNGFASAAMAIGAMSLTSQSGYNTPRSGVVGLAEEEEEEEYVEAGVEANKKMSKMKLGVRDGDVEVRVIGVDPGVGEEEDERAVGKMDVDC